MASRHGRNSAIAQYNRSRPSQSPGVKCAGSGMPPTNEPLLEGWGYCRVCGMGERLRINGNLTSHKHYTD